MGSDEREAKVEQLKQDDDIRRELEQASPDIEPKKPVVETKHKFWLLTYLLALIGFAVIVYLLRLDFFDFGRNVSYSHPAKTGSRRHGHLARHA